MTVRRIPSPAEVLRVIMTSLCLLGCVAAQAQFRVDVSGIGMKQLPIAVAAFRG